MPQFESLTLKDGTRFVSHRKQGGDMFVFEVRDGNILSISISSMQISSYRALLVKKDAEGNKVGSYEDTAMASNGGKVGSHEETAVAPEARHDAIHYLGISNGMYHDHFCNRPDKSQRYGIAMLPCLVTHLGATDLMEIIRLAKSTAA